MAIRGRNLHSRGEVRSTFRPPEAVRRLPTGATDARLEGTGEAARRHQMQAEQSRDAEGDALTPEEIGELVERFHRDGYAPVRGVLTGEEVAALREAADAIFADPEQKEKHRHGFDFVIARLYEGPE